MLGHGGPTYRCDSGAPAAAVAGVTRPPFWLACCLSGLIAATAWPAPSDSPPIDAVFRVEWGDGAPGRWRVRLAASQGVFASPRRLGLSADSPGTWRVEPQQIVIHQNTPRTYDGLEFRWTASADAVLTLEAVSLDDGEEPRRTEATMRELLAGGKRLDLPGQQRSADDKLLIRRAPGDSLRLGVDAAALVFSPNDSLDIRVQPHQTQLEAGAYRLRLVVEGGGGVVHWSQERDVRLDDHGSAEPWHARVDLPQDEGVYDVRCEMTRRRIASPFMRSAVLFDRKIQLAVIATQSPTASRESWRVVADIDPAQPNKPDWIDRITGLKILSGSGMPKSFGQGDTIVERDGTSLTALDGSGWKAIPLPIQSPGQPHVVEIDLPRLEAQSLGVSILERNATGSFASTRFEAGVDLPLAFSSTTATRQYRLVFWPRTTNSLLVLSNLRRDKPAAFGPIRLHAGPRLLAAAMLQAGGDERLAAAYFDQPWFSDVFNADEALEPARNATLDDWRTFHQGAQRLTQYLQYVGYNAAVLCVVRDGGGLYPSTLLQPSPRFDSGAFFVSGQDPHPKDVLEMLFRIFDREGLKLIPSLHFSGTLPELESLRHYGDPAGLLLVGADGRPKHHANGAPAYNPLDPRVGQAMRRVVNELIDRYEGHPSFGGVSIQLSPHASVQLPGELWGLDEATFARFQKELGLQEPASDFAERAALVRGKLRSAWLRWRADKMTEWFLKLRDDLRQSRSDALLVLGTADLFQVAELETHLRPRLTGAVGVESAALGAGLQLERLREQPGVLAPRPYRLGSPFDLTGQAVNAHAAAAHEVDLSFTGPEDRRAHHAASSLFFHEPRPHALANFPVVDNGPPSTLSITAHVAPGDVQTRRWMVRSLAAYDSQHWLIGGWSPPMGQEAHLRDLLTLYRRLPVAPFARVEPEEGDDHTQPLTVRQAHIRGRTYLYVVNDSPWPMQADLSLRTSVQTTIQSLDARPCEPLELGDGGPRWRVSLDPYDVRGAWLDSVNAQVLNWRVATSDELTPDLQRRVREVQARANSVAPRKYEALSDPGFEQDDWIASKAWRHNTQPGVQVARDAAVMHHGLASLRLQSTGPVAWVRSNPFPVPATGRLYVQVLMRVSNPSEQPRLRVALDSGRGFYTYLPVGADAGAYQVGDAFSRRYLFPFDNLPTDVSQLQIGFDLMGAGEVWIDDVQLYDIWFEGQELSKLIYNATLADMGLLKKAKVGACLDFLDDYWSRFLLQHVELDSQPHMAVLPRGEPANATEGSQDEKAAAEPRTAWDRVRDLVPKSPLRRR